MSELQTSEEHEWVAPFLRALRGGDSIRAAARVANVPRSTAMHYRTRNLGFRDAWDACLPDAKLRVVGDKAIAKRERFLAELAATSNVTAAAVAAGLTTGAIYTLRRSDPDFARRWYAALAEGYDNLEMELLGRLRGGEVEGDTPKVKFDTATALRCLTAHRENVAREKGRRTLATEVATIAAINARIDAMRLKQETTQKAIANVRKAKIAQTKSPRHCQEPRRGDAAIHGPDVPQQTTVVAGASDGPWIAASPSAPRNDEDEGKRGHG